jgi:hypothetical protein
VLVDEVRHIVHLVVDDQPTVLCVIDEARRKRTAEW